MHDCFSKIDVDLNLRLVFFLKYFLPGAASLYKKDVCDKRLVSSKTAAADETNPLFMARNLKGKPTRHNPASFNWK